MSRYAPYNPNENSLLLVKAAPANDKIKIFGIFPKLEAIKNIHVFTELNPQTILTTGAGMIGTNRHSNMAVKELRFKNCSYSCTLGYFSNLSCAQSRKPYRHKKKKHIVPTIAPVREILAPNGAPKTAPIVAASIGNGTTGKKTQIATNSMLTTTERIPPALIISINASFWVYPIAIMAIKMTIVPIFFNILTSHNFFIY